MIRMHVHKLYNTNGCRFFRDKSVYVRDMFKLTTCFVCFVCKIYNIQLFQKYDFKN